MIVMKSGTRYEKKKGQDRPSYKKYFECNKCHDRVYINKSNFQDFFKEDTRKK